MKNFTIGILAHVDSGKTTLSEGLLYSAGEIRKLGRVDHKNTFLDTDSLEKERGITIFSKQAVLKTENSLITLLDTPGHVDFSAETERVLSVLDYAILVISGTDGVQSHTVTLWSLLKSHNIPVFIFINKMDISPYDKESLLVNLQNKLNESCLIIENTDKFYENAAMCSEEAMNMYLEQGLIDKNTIMKLIKERKIFPCFFGSALKQDGVDSFLNIIDEYSLPSFENESFGAKVFKITQDEQGNRLTHLKITGSSLKVKQTIQYNDCDGNEITEKINSIRIYSGNKFTTIDEATQGTICSVVGMSKSYSGQGLGFEKSDVSVILEPVFSYKVNINDGTDPITALSKFKKLQEEEPQLKVNWNSTLKEIHLCIMGEIQCEILKRIIYERFSLDVDFVEGSILYKETIEQKVEGVGHYEPLKHYAEVHLLIEPQERGSGITIETECTEDELSKNWQRLIVTHLKEKTHLGVLTGSPLTDVKITLISGRAHLKHTEGGDFRQATYRALRQGLMQAKSILLEPIYSFILEVPSNCVGRAMTDVENMGGNISITENDADFTVLTGTAPVSKMRSYYKDVISYTKGKGKLSCKLTGYNCCKNQDVVVNEINYNPEADLDNTPDSVFCAHGAGFSVKWDEVFNYMHLPLYEQKYESKETTYVHKPKTNVSNCSDGELMRVFEMTYGKINSEPYKEMKTPKNIENNNYKGSPKKYDKTILLVDGYNVIYSHDELKLLAKDNLEHAREQLIEMLYAYKTLKKEDIIVVFDAYNVKDNTRKSLDKNGISIVYTKEDETADAYIEKATHQLCKNNRVYVATSDGLEQLIILGQGAIRIPTSQFLDEIKNADKVMRKILEDYNKKHNTKNHITMPISKDE